MSDFIDLTGKRFGMLVAQKTAGKRDSSRGFQWWCKCDCGSLSIKRGANLRNGTSKSCGCQLRIAREKFAKARLRQLRDIRFWPKRK